MLAREDAPGDQRLVAYVVARPRRRGPRPAELRALPAGSACRSTWSRRPSCVLAGPAADRPTARSTAGRCPRPAAAAVATGAASVAPRTPARGAARGDLVARCSGVRAGGRRRQLLRARRPLAAGDPGGLAAARAVRRRAAAARAVRGAHRGRAGADASESARAGRRSGRRRRRSGATPRDGRPAARRSPRSGSGSSTSCEPGSAAYNIPGRGPPRRAARRRRRLRRAFAEIVRRHEALRTTFADRRRASRAGDPAAGVGDAAADRPRRPAGARPRGRGAARWPRPRRARPFDLATGPLLRVTLLRAGRGGARAAADHAPHRLRRLVDGRAGARARQRSTRPSRPGAPSPPAGAARPVRRLRGLAARVAAGRRCWSGSSPTGGSSWPARPPSLELPTDRPRPAVQRTAAADRRVHASAPS